MPRPGLLGSFFFWTCMSACSPSVERGDVLGPSGVVPAIAWSAEEIAKDVAVRTLRVTDTASFHAIHLRTAEPPHVHDRSDLLVVVLRGSVEMHLGDQVLAAGPGDVIEVPKGVPHWAKNSGDAPGEAYVVFTPAFDGKDRRLVPTSAAR